MQYNVAYGREDQRNGEKGVSAGDEGHLTPLSDEYSYVEPLGDWKPEAPQLPPPRKPPLTGLYEELVK